MNLAFIEQRLGEKTQNEVLFELEDWIKRIDGKSLLLTVILADLLHRTTSWPRIKRLYDGLLTDESEESLLPLKLRLDLLKPDYEAALETSSRWIKLAPLNPDAVHMRMTVLGQAFADFEAAIDVGRKALRLIPSNANIRNALAYYLALSGRCTEASEMLATCADLDWPVLHATRGLISLGEGDLENGLGSYDKAIDVLRRRIGNGIASKEFENLARLNEWIGLNQFGLMNHSEVINRNSVRLPKDWTVDSSYLLLFEMVKRLGQPWPDALIN
jgi:tetratricopeptide (TPR) repeat protein